MDHCEHAPVLKRTLPRQGHETTAVVTIFEAQFATGCSKPLVLLMLLLYLTTAAFDHC